MNRGSPIKAWHVVTLAIAIMLAALLHGGVYDWSDRDELRDDEGGYWHEVSAVRKAIQKATGRKPLAEMPEGYYGQHSARKVA